MKSTCLSVISILLLSVLGCVQSNPNLAAHNEQPFVPLDSIERGGSPATTSRATTAAEEEYIDWQSKPMIPVVVKPAGSTAKPASTPAVRDEVLAPRGSSASTAGMRQHAVRKGDTLYRLAREYYGNEARWRDIYDANRTQLRNADTIAVGMTLVIP
ncbi:MAG: LysM peptidoglycan-binding domain-containing protein [Phycisphaerae bacterium]|nr:LysM peptidoglycan-binding domain-containing protein [Phycisphaerae bacterium]